MKKLWKVKVEKTLLVLAKDPAEAKKESISWWFQEELKKEKPSKVVECQITSLGQVPPGWMRRIPYGKNLSRLVKGKSVQEFLERKLYRERSREKN